MLATALRFLLKKKRKQTLVKVSCHALLAIVVMCYFSVQSGCFICLLLQCGDIEPNPGPGPTGPTNGNIPLSQQQAYYSWANQPAHGTPPLDSFFAQFSDTLNQSVLRMERTSYQQGKNIEKQIKSVEDKIDRRLTDIERKQTGLTRDVGDLRSHCQSLWAENKELRSSVDLLSGKCEHLDSQSRRNNLVFIGLTVRSGPESYVELVDKVKAVVQYGIGLNENFEFDHVRKAGKAVIVTFKSFNDKMLVLSNARNLSSSTQFGTVFVHEDFTEAVQMKRKELRYVQRQMRQEGRSARLRHDKLITDNAVFTYDLHQQRLTQLENRRRPWAPVRRDPTSHQHHHQRPASMVAPPAMLQPASAQSGPPRLSESASRNPATPPDSAVTPVLVNDPAHDTVPASRPDPVLDPALDQTNDSDDEDGPGLWAGPPDPVPVSGTSHALLSGDSRGRQQSVPPAGGPASSQHGSNYNLRTRRGPAAAAGLQNKSTPSDDDHGAVGGDPGDYVSPRLRGFGRGRGTPQSQPRIDAMLQASQDKRRKTYSHRESDEGERFMNASEIMDGHSR
jgi:hypothetical protein